MTTASSFKDLRIWQESIDLAVEIYQATTVFPKHETYGLTSQMRRAAVSIASNIAEGKDIDRMPNSCASCFTQEGLY
jgi:four helix bundle protein